MFVFLQRNGLKYLIDGETENFDACNIQNESKYGNVLEVALEYPINSCSRKGLCKMKDTIHIMLMIS